MKRTGKREKVYTAKQIVQEFGVSEDQIKRFFRKPAIHQVSGTHDTVLSWTKSQVEKGLKNPGLIAEQKKESRQRSMNTPLAQEIRKFLSQFDIENMKEHAKTLNRYFVLHIGPTNSGKTHDAIEELKRAESGLYLGPLRLLALEMFDRLNWENCPTSLLTGEESIEIYEAEHISSTIELCDYSRHYDVAVIDEAQMITDNFRGDKWAKAIYMVDASEVHVCLAPEAELLICEILDSFGAEYEIIRHKRLAPLEYAGLFKSIRDVQPGDALIVFSRKAVLSVAAELESMGIQASVIYGALPPASRREEVRRFAEGQTNVVVATDAIGMGVSLPIKRVIFCTTTKFDGVGARKLFSNEIKQIAGRAGRYGIYNKGEVLTMEEEDLVRHSLTCPEPQVRRLTLPFPSEAVDSDYPLDELMVQWDALPDGKEFSRANMADAIYLYKKLRPIAAKMDRWLVYSLITCPVDIKVDELVLYWRECCFAIYREKPLPEPYAGDDTLEECELRYKELDIRHQLLRRIGIEEDRMAEKLKLCNKINEFLEKDKDKYLRHCSHCGRVLPATAAYGVCDRCFKRLRGLR